MSTNKDKIRASAQKYLQKGQLDKAIREFERLLEDDPNDVRTLLKIGDLQVRKGDQVAATKTYGNVAKYYSDQGFFLKAVAVYKQILKLDPTLMDISVRLAELYHQLGLASDALQQFRQICELLEKADKTEEAANVVRKMVELDPEGLPSRLKLAELELKLGKKDEAKAGLSRVANQLLKDNRQEEYLKVAERLFHVDPDDAVTARELARLYMQRNDPRRALGKLQVCFHANPKDTEVLAWLGDAFKELGQAPKAIAAWRELAAVQRDAGQSDAWHQTLKLILALDPSDADARAAMHQGGTGPRSSGQIQSALDSVELPDDGEDMELLAAEPLDEELVGDDLVQDMPSEPVSEEGAQKLLIEVEIYIKYGLRNKAIEHLETILAAHPNHREAQERLKGVLLDADDVSAAAAILVRMAEQSVANGNEEQARNDVEELMGVDPQNAAGRELMRRLGAHDVPIIEGAPIEDEAFDDIGVMFDAPEDGVAHDEDDDDTGIGVSIEVEADVPATIGYKPAASAATLSLDEEFVDPPAQSLDEEFVDPPSPESLEFEVDPEAMLAAEIALEPEPDPEPEPKKPEPARAAPLPPPSRPMSRPAAALDLDIDALVGGAVPAMAPASPSRAPSSPPANKGVAVVAAKVQTPTHAPASPPVKRPEPGVAPVVVQATAPVFMPPQDDDFTGGKTSAIIAFPDLSDDLDEVSFMLQQGLEDDAREVLDNLLNKYPTHPGVLALHAQLSAASDNEALAAAAEPLLQHDPGRVEAALAEEMALVPQEEGEGQIAFDDVFDQFKKGVAEQVDASDYDTHFNLGIAYKEMGLLDDAIRQFVLCSESPAFEINALTMVGLCQLQRDAVDEALAAFMKGLSSPRVTAREVIALRYEIGLAYEGMGHYADAAKFYEKACAMDPTFRDVSARLAETQSHGDEGSDAGGGELDALLGDSPVRKNDKISYL